MAKIRLRHTRLRNVWHIWAHQEYAQYGPEQNYGKGGDNESFRGSLAYSYATIVATRHEVVKTNKGNGKTQTVTTVPVFLFNKSYISHSVSTSQHMRGMRQAATNLGLSFIVPYTYNYYDTYGAVQPLTERQHVANIAYMSDKIAKALGKAKRARTYKDLYNADALDLQQAIKDYVEVFGLDVKLIPSDMSLEAFMAHHDEIRKAEAKRRAEAAKQARIEAEENIQKWLAGDRYAYVSHIVNEAFLRIAPTYSESPVPTIEATMVQTSHNAVVPMRHIARVLPIVLLMVKSGKAWHTNGQTIRLGNYRLESISANGTVKVGCHTFLKDEILRFAAIVETWIKATGYDRKADTAEAETVTQ